MLIFDTKVLKLNYFYIQLYFITLIILLLFIAVIKFGVIYTSNNSFIPNYLQKDLIIKMLLNGSVY